MILNQYENQPQQVKQIADKITQKLVEIITTQGKATIAVSGGKSPIALFKELSTKNIEWNKVTITLVDERFIDTNDDDSNEKLVRKHLLIDNASNAEFISLVSTRDIIASTANANLQVPKIDVAILGMGEDGHTASLFPCAPEIKNILENDDILMPRYVITTPSTAKYKRIGLSLTALLEIPHLILSINGDKKLTILNKSIAQLNPIYPISYVLNNRTDIEVFWYK